MLRIFFCFIVLLSVVDVNVVDAYAAHSHSLSLKNRVVSCGLEC